MGWGVSYPIQVNYTDSQQKEVKSKMFSQNEYIQPTLYTILGIGLALEKKNFGIAVEAALRVNGILTVMNYFNHNKFEYSKYNEQSFGSRYFERSLGVSFRFF